MYDQEKIMPYESSEAKGKQVERMFDGIAHSYDLLNHVLSFDVDRSWRNKTINALRQFRHDRVLDVATGTGDFAILTAKKLQPKELVACDLSEGMMEVGRKKVEQSGLMQTVRFQREDCMSLSFADNSFDIVTVAYGVRNFEDLDKGLCEICRVLSEGGRLAILELCVPQRFPMKQCFWLYSHVWMPLMGRLISGDVTAYRYLPATMEAFPQGEVMKSILEKAGFHDVRFKRFTFGLSTMYLAQK